MTQWPGMLLLIENEARDGETQQLRVGDVTLLDIELNALRFVITMAWFDAKSP